MISYKKVFEIAKDDANENVTDFPQFRQFLLDAKNRDIWYATKM